MSFISKITSSLIILMIISSCYKPKLLDFELLEEKISFTHSGNHLAGVLSKPEGEQTFPVVIFVHGDGAADRYDHGYYKYIWKQLNQQGIACMSWDKPGVGKSTGNWLKQSIDDRAKEAASAARHLKQRGDIGNIILWGFSQGCWVVPKTNQIHPEISAIIFQSPAINWLRQGKYHLHKRLKNQGYEQNQISICLNYFDSTIRFLEQGDYQGYKKDFEQRPKIIRDALPLIPEDRWHFIVKNFESDIQNDLETVNIPVLALFGAKDENVDAQESIMTFDTVFSWHSEYTGVLFKNADHTLFDINQKGKTDTEDDVWYKLLYKGKDVFAKGYLSEVKNFLQQF